MLATYIKNHTDNFMSTKALHKEWREHFNEEVLKRDSNQCKICGVAGVLLDVHHITDRSEMPNGGYSPKNGITLCSKHHVDAEKYHASNKNEWVDGFHPNDLYKLIGSSYEEAVKECKNL
jgi:predicted restriction endonuclease